MISLGARLYYHIFQAGVSVDKVIDEHGDLRLNKLKKLTEKKVVERQDGQLYDQCRTLMIQLKWGFVSLLKVLYYEYLIAANHNTQCRPYKYPPLLMVQNRETRC